MGVYASLLSLLILHTVLLSSLPIASSLEHGVVNQTATSVHPHQQVSVRPQGGGGEGEKRRAGAGGVEGWFVSMKAKGGRSGGLGGNNINHHPKQNGKNAASSLLKPASAASFAADCAGLILLVLIFF